MSKAAFYADNLLDNGDALIRQHLFLVKRIAHHIVARLPANIDVEDLIQVGLIGLLDAAKNYNAALGAGFETYAGIRIRGAILDELRRTDWVPRTVQLKARQLAQAIREVENQLQRPAKDSEIAQHMSLDIDTYHTMLREASICRAVQFDTAELETTTSQNPGDNLEADAFKADLAAKIAQLPEREQLVMSLYYDDELNLKEIGEVLGVSESRISQIHSQAIARLRAQLDSWTDLSKNNRP